MPQPLLRQASTPTDIKRVCQLMNELLPDVIIQTREFEHRYEDGQHVYSNRQASAEWTVEWPACEFVARLCYTGLTVFDVGYRGTYTADPSNHMDIDSVSATNLLATLEALKREDPESRMDQNSIMERIAAAIIPVEQKAAITVPEAHDRAVRQQHSFKRKQERISRALRHYRRDVYMVVSDAKPYPDSNNHLVNRKGESPGAKFARLVCKRLLSNNEEYRLRYPTTPYEERFAGRLSRDGIFAIYSDGARPSEREHQRETPPSPRAKRRREIP